MRRRDFFELFFEQARIEMWPRYSRINRGGLVIAGSKLRSISRYLKNNIPCAWDLLSHRTALVVFPPFARPREMHYIPKQEKSCAHVH
jgi:hypothetical protein